MAKVTNNILLKGMSGPIGGKLYRTFKDKTIYGKIPDMSGIKPSKKQTRKRSLFAAAVKYARSVMKDPAESAKFKGNDRSVYHAAIKEYMAWFKPEELEKLTLRPALRKTLKRFTLTDQQQRAIAFILTKEKLTNGYYRKINNVSKATATRHLQELADYHIIQFNKGRGTGAHYIMGSLLKK